jgi:hypothetical protein
VTGPGTGNGSGSGPDDAQEQGGRAGDGGMADDVPEVPGDPGAPGGTGDIGESGEPGAGEPIRLETITVGSRLARRRRALRPVAGRTTALVVAGSVVLGVGLLSAAVPAPTAPSVAPVGDGVAVAPAAAHASSFFCTSGAGSDAGAGATGRVVLTNTTGSPAQGFLTTVGATGAPVATGVTVPARGSAEVVPSLGLHPGTTASATTFSFARGGVTGTAVVTGPHGWSTAPCPSQVASQWDFAGGSTNSGALDLSLYNPTAAPAVVGVTFLTANGNVLDPQSYQGIPVAPGQLVVEALGAYVQNQPVVATLVQCASGAVVATELDHMVVSSGSGLSLLSGTPGLATTWHFAQTTAVQGGAVTLAVANPGTAPVTAVITVGLSAASVEPRHLTVPGRSVASFVASAIAGWPLGSPYSLTVTASAPVVVGRTVIAPAGGAAPQSGIVTGTTAVSRAWLVAGPGTPGNPAVPGAGIHTLAVANPGRSPVDVTVRRLGDGHTVAMARVPADGVVVLAQHWGGLQPLVITATGPVGIEADATPVGAPGIVAWSGFPLGS